MHRLLLPCLFLLSACGWKEIRVENPAEPAVYQIDAKEIEYEAKLEGKQATFDMTIKDTELQGAVSSFTPGNFTKISGSAVSYGSFSMKRWTFSCMPPFFVSKPNDLVIEYRPENVTGGTLVIRYR